MTLFQGKSLVNCSLLVNKETGNTISRIRRMRILENYKSNGTNYTERYYGKPFYVSTNYNQH